MVVWEGLVWGFGDLSSDAALPHRPTGCLQVNLYCNPLDRPSV